MEQGSANSLLGNVTFLVKKPLKRVTLTVTFAGVTKLEKYPIPFYTTTQELFVGGKGTKSQEINNSLSISRSSRGPS